MSERDVLFAIHTNKKFTLEACKLTSETTPRVIRYRHNPDQVFLSQLEDERSDVSRAPAAAVVQYFRSGMIDRTYEALMDVDPETNLERLNAARNGRPWSQEELLKLIAQILQGLDILHKAEIVHRHLAPYYIYVPRDGPAKFSDLFHQSYCEYGETANDEFKADSIYRAPETLEERPVYDGRIDIWSIGVMMYELASGQFPFPQKNAYKIYFAIQRRKITPIPDSVPPTLRDIIGKMLTFDANERPNAETLLKEPCFSKYRPSLQQSSAAPKARVRPPPVVPRSSHFTDPYPTRRQKFLDALSAIQPVKLIGSCKVLFPSDANIEQSMVVMYQKTRAEILEPFYVMLEGTNAVDVNGIKRWFFTKLVEKLIDPTQLGLFWNDGSPDGKLTISSGTKYQAPEYFQIYKFAGLILGKALLERLNVPFRFNPFIWKQLQGLPMEPSDLKYVNQKMYNNMEEMRTFNQEAIDEAAPKWTCTLPDGSTADLIPGGGNERVLECDIADYVDLASLVTLNYYTPLLTAMRSELHALVPEHVLRLLSPEELELEVCGKAEIDVADWRKNTYYCETLRKNEKVIAAFWTVVDRSSNTIRQEILRLGTGLTNAPPTGFKDLKRTQMDRVGGFNMQALNTRQPVMPEGHMCYNRLDIPLLEDADILQAMIMKAIRNAAPPTDEGYAHAI
ncbi:putative E3 ubiquitin-protein ligase Nedd-4 [Blattamonas nauphoetae]|uniref:HECT-type E3 ubiquitin transferase n=1 Tax=Blattamonas nauphoetae TaxID=2049346 RepID=A0ABQ9X2D9_9EUKA|nr:putative E3 ubiquitin-protein ligase Nedd-4 [Blattamonas nauphoetae]